MGIYIVRRLFWISITLLAVSFFTFMLIFALPTDPVDVLTGRRAQAEAKEALRHELGLDRPILVQYVDYMGRLFRGDLGTSYYFKIPVSQALFSRFPATAQLALCIMGLSLALGLPMGVLAAVKNRSLLDRGMMVAGMVLISVPGFLFGLLLIYIFAFRVRWLPAGGHGTWRHLILPGLSVALPWAVYYGTILRSNLLDVLAQDYVRTAYGKGLPQRRVVTRHMLKNAVLPLVTMLGMDFAALLTGLAFVEYVFAWPGIGWQALQAAQRYDVPMVMGSVLFGALLISGGNLVVDILYTYLDPRTRLS